MNFIKTMECAEQEFLVQLNVIEDGESRTVGVITPCRVACVAAGLKTISVD